MLKIEQGKPAKRTAIGYAFGPLSTKPKVARTPEGVAVCRLSVLQEPVGIASPPVRMDFYAKGELAERCGAKLKAGDVIESYGRIGPARAGVLHQEVLAHEVKLWEEAGAAA